MLKLTEHFTEEARKIAYEITKICSNVGSGNTMRMHVVKELSKKKHGLEFEQATPLDTVLKSIQLLATRPILMGN